MSFRGLWAQALATLPQGFPGLAVHWMGVQGSS